MKLLALDIDGTLLYVDKYHLIERPYLKEFLLFCFQKFDCVGLWTAGYRQYLNYIKENILEPILLELNPNYKFGFAFSRDECTNEYEKPLNLLWNDVYNENNSLIIDDHIESFQCNIDNGILIPSFYPENRDIDDILIDIMIYLRYLSVYYEINNTFKNARKNYTIDF